jgi:thiol-disulfide isomerase/thioredoxin
MKNKILAVALLMLSTIALQAQTITLEFPYFAGYTYDFKIFQGDKLITLKKDTIPNGGKVQLTIPKEYADYKGMGQWYLTNSETGGGLDLIINNEDFSVSCFDSIPTSESIVYKNTKENLFDKANYQKQQKLFEKHDAMLATTKAYKHDTKIYKRALKEYESLKKEYVVYTKGLSNSPLYAAKFRQIVNVTMGIGTLITQDEIEKANNINTFLVEELDYNVLYTSNHWYGVINNWVQLQTMVFKDDAKMIADAKTILSRIKEDKVYTDFVISLTKELTKAGKDTIIEALTPVIKNSQKLERFDGFLSVYQLDLSGKAPDLIISNSLVKTEENNQGSTVLKTDALQSKYSLLVFYKSGCGPCEITIAGLIENYQKIKAKNIRIITLSADVDEEVYTTTAAQFPWKDSYCNFKGTEGVNFKNYAVMGTPTMYLLDSKGIIIKKIATYEQVLVE